jgi:hypothetical protein
MAPSGAEEAQAGITSSQPTSPAALALRRTPGGLWLRAFFVGLVIQVVTRIITHGPRFMDFQGGEFSGFINAIVMYFPILIAADMGYREGQSAMLARRLPASGNLMTLTIEQRETGDNPYQSPQFAAVESPSIEQAQLHRVARAQKRILLGILANVVVIIAMLVVPQFKAPLNIGIYVVGFVTAVFVFQLATQLYGKVAGIGLGLLTILPFIGLIVLLIVNGRAIRMLERNGIRVGFFGANGERNQ